MAGSGGAWDRYLRWNDAVAAVVYSREAAGNPVYLDLDDDVLAAILDGAEPGASNPTSTLCQVVKDTLVLRDGASHVLRGHIRRLDLWHDGPMFDPPPTLALLAMLSLVAETMHEGEGMKPHNFYGRLAQLLELDHQELDWLRSAYRRTVDGVAVSAKLWGALNDWLETLEGNRGLPTAVALGHEHIGLPLSQALVRRGDRERFGDLFALHSLPPRSSLPAFDMENLIAEWMSRKPCPASNTLERLWNSGPELRSRITTVALQALESWDGATSEPSAAGAIRAPVDIVRARAALRTFPARYLELGLVITARTSDDVEELEVVGADGAVVGVLELVPAASGYLSLATPEAIDTASFLGGEVLLRRSGQSEQLRRRPRRVVPMRYDELLLAYVECERVQLGEETLVLVRRTIAPTAVKVLEVIARPGFVVADDLPGLPSGWTLVSGVQVLSSIPDDLRARIPVDLNVLQPITASQVVLQGGLRLPGNIAKWSSSIPPELRASAGADADLAASIRCTCALTSPPPRDRKTEGAGSVLIWDLAQEALPDGDYEITVSDAGAELRAETLRLRSADSPAVLVEPDLAPIGHDPTSPTFGLLATRTAKTSAIRGARPDGAALEEVAPPNIPRWYTARRDPSVRSAQVEQVRFPAPDDRSCMVTGAHYLDLPTVMPGAGIKTIQGVCRTCGLVKRQPAFRARRRRSPRSGPTAAFAPKIDVSGLAPVRASESIDWPAAFDAVCHVGAGPASALARIASQMEGTSLFGDAFERRLELLGHIEIERRLDSLAAQRWEVVEPLVIGLDDGSATLIGFRSERMMVAVDDQVWRCRGTLVLDAVDAPPAVRVEGLTESELEKLAVVIGEATGKVASFIPRAAERLCAALPPLSRVRGCLPTTTSLTARGYEAWNPVTARFGQASDAGHPGAFRLTSFTRTYIYRTSEDVDSMRATLGDARIVKYLAAADAGRSLIGYDSPRRVLYVPLGADLPGLYGRAAALASGRPPVENVEERILEYHNVSPSVAGQLDRLLMT